MSYGFGCFLGLWQISCTDLQGTLPLLCPFLAFYISVHHLDFSKASSVCIWCFLHSQKENNKLQFQTKRQRTNRKINVCKENRPNLKEKERIIITAHVWKLVKHSLHLSILYNNKINIRSESSVKHVRTST